MIEHYLNDVVVKELTFILTVFFVFLIIVIRFSYSLKIIIQVILPFITKFITKMHIRFPHLIKVVIN